MPDANLDKVAVWIQAFIPMAIVDALGMCFSGDDREFSANYNEGRYRVRSEIAISGFLTGAPEWIEFHQVGETHRVDCATGDVLEAGTAESGRMSFHDFQVGNTYPDPEGVLSISRTGRTQASSTTAPPTTRSWSPRPTLTSTCAARILSYIA